MAALLGALGLVAAPSVAAPSVAAPSDAAPPAAALSEAAPPVANASDAPPHAATAEPGLASGDEPGAPAPGRPAGDALPHVQLIDSEPAAGDTLAEPPRRIRLLFSEAVDATLADLRLRLPDGSVTELTPRADPDDPRAVLATPPRLGSGAHRLGWRIISADGHPVSGEVPFLVAPPEDEASEEVVTEPPDDAVEPPAEVEEEPFGLETAAPGLAALLRGIAVGLLLALGGLLLFQAWLVTEPSRRVRRVVGFLAVATPLALAAHLVAWLQYLAPAGSGFNPTWIVYGLSTETGRWELVRTGAAFFALWAATGKARRPGLAAALVVVGVLASGAVGHPAVSEAAWAIPAKSLHLLAVAFWLGGVLWLVAAEKDAPDFFRNARRVSRVALVAVLVVAATGIAQGFDFLTGLEDLLATSYGRLYLGKVAGLVILVLFGAWNRFRILPRAAEGAPPSELRRSVALEVAVMVAVLLVAGFLAYVPPPGL